MDCKSRIRRMWKCYKLLYLLRAYPYRPGAYQGDKYHITSTGIKKDDFVGYMRFRRYESVWQKLKARLISYGLIENKATEAGVARLQKHNNSIDLTIARCREKGYLEPITVTQNLKFTGKGYHFSGWSGLGFINEVFREYGPTLSFVFGAGGATVVYAILQFLPKTKENLGL